MTINTGSSVPQLRVASFNIACSRRDEEHFPLHSRLESICTLLQTHQQSFDILCLQEVRSTGQLTERDVVQKIVSSLSGNWHEITWPVNMTNGAFFRTTIYNRDVYELTATEFLKTPNLREAQYPYLMMRTEFKHLVTDVLFEVQNLHAPMAQKDKELYWNASMNTFIDNSCELESVVALAIGDVNKFEEHLDTWNTILESASAVDLITPELTTFHSFPVDKKPNGDPWISSLDAVVVCDDDAENWKVTIYDTISQEVRPSDHYLIIATRD